MLDTLGVQSSAGGSEYAPESEELEERADEESEGEQEGDDLHQVNR